MTVDMTEDLIWLIENKKAVDFEFWCAEHNYESGDPQVLRSYIEKHNKPIEKEKMSNSFSPSVGYFVKWIDESNTKHEIFNLCKDYINTLFSILKMRPTNRFVKKFKIIDGKEVEFV